ncbi:MAG: NTP transferase domain-containing protein [Candidatus Sungbacteria bacterium]|nr:NTP transferase domain-containing protein [Candidatus Sungbacteria bacterium]
MKTRVVILAAGRGTRMNTETPKVLIPFQGKPMIGHLLGAVKDSGVDSRPVIVTGFQAPLVERTLGPAYDYVRQDKQLGTGHAVACAESLLAGRADTIIVLNGDHPFVKASTIAALAQLHEREQCALSMMTVMLEDFTRWRASFADFGRIIRDHNKKITSVIEVKDATPEQHEIREVNPNFFCFRASWLWPNIRKLGNDNAKGEYYLTDMVRLAIAEGECIASMSVSPREAIGLNTPEHLRLAEGLR